ncbi:hypothetical protein N665_0111s0025 [Sinapis alba]|nr:hypothetical protein N665_0111s0025 [Sinapis alba]
MFLTMFEDTTYVCYAIDREKGDVCEQEVHEVYVHLPISRSTRSSLIPNALNAQKNFILMSACFFLFTFVSPPM